VREWTKRDEGREKKKRKEKSKGKDVEMMIAIPSY